VKYFSAFTGVGGFDMGMPSDWECVGHSEIDKYANMVLKYRFKGVKNYGNAEKINWKEVPDFDLLVGGTPCQDLSISGKRAGLNGSRSRLFFEFARALREKKPQYFIWENVKGALSSNGGWDFARVLLALSEAGYSVWWQVLDAAWFGVPQHRERVFVAGSLGDEPPLKILFRPGHAGTPAGIQRQPANTITRRYHGAQATGSYVVESKLNAQKTETINKSGTQIKRIYGINGVAPTLQMSFGGYHDVKIAIPVLTPNRMEKRQNGRRFKENGEPAFTLTRQDTHGIFDGKTIRTLTPLECERLMGWPDNWTRYGIDAEGNTVEISDTQRYNLTGNGVVPQVVSVIMENMVIEK
jgi:DNA (cytosine-5)-methyltransferase 1